MSSNKLSIISARLLSAAIILVLVCGSVDAQVPRLLNYQGRLTSAATPVDTAVSITFTLYADSTGAATVWTETHPAVLVDDGLFAVLLGSVTPLPPGVFSDSSRYLGVKVGDDPESRPLSRITAAAYALKAARADTASYAESTSGGGSGWTDDGSVVRLTTASDKIGIGTATPANMVHIVGSDSEPLLNIEKTGNGRGLRVSTTSACALWVAASGNHGLRVTSANGDGVHVTAAGGYAGYFNGKGYFGGNLGIGTLVAGQRLDVAGGSIRTDGQLMSTTATGTAPLDVQSETLVTNLNADMLDGLHAAQFAEACAGTDSVTVDGASSVTISFSGADFSTTPMLSVSALVLSGGSGAGWPARIVSQSVTPTGATLTLHQWNDYVYANLGLGQWVQVSWVAVE